MNIKKIISYLVVAAIMISAVTFVSSCSKDGDKGDKGDKGEQGEEGPEGPTNTFVVTFDYDNGTTVTQTVLGGAWAVQPPAPTIAFPTEAGLYEGTVSENVPAFKWFEEGKEDPFNFYAPITGNITLKQVAIASIGTVAANNVTEAVNYAKANPGEYTLLIDADVNAGEQTLNVANVKLTIIGIGEERTIGPDLGNLFKIDGAGASLTLGQNITLRGIATGNRFLVYVGDGSLTMLAGSKITGHTTTGGWVSAGVVIDGATSSFTMHGGEITGNHAGDNFIANNTGGVWVGNSATFTMTGGSITGNTRGDSNEAMDVYLFGTEATANASKTGGTIGVSIPAEFAGN